MSGSVDRFLRSKGSAMTKKVVKTQKLKKVIICGTADTSKGLIPWQNDEFEFWGLGWRDDLPRCDLYFDMHAINDERKRVPKNYIQFLNARTTPLVHVEARPDIKNLIVYPLEEVCNFLRAFDEGYAPRAYFASSIAYMIAYAMYLHYDEIGIFGVDLIDDDEYIWQKPNTEYLIGLARGSGIKVYIPEESALCHYSHIYGYEQRPDLGPIGITELRDRIKSYEEKKNDALAAMYTVDGALQESKDLLRKLQLTQRGRKHVPAGKKGKTKGN